MNKKKKSRKLLFSALLVVLGILFRTTWHIGPNVEFVTTATLLSARYLGRRWAMAVPLLIMVVSDLAIGNTNIFIFTWSGYIIIGILGYWDIRVLADKLRLERLPIKFFWLTKTAVWTSVWFYLWTNFGVWLLDSWGMYDKTWTGLVDAYIMGIPFLKYNIIGNLVFVPLSFFTAEYVLGTSFSLSWFQKVIRR